MELIELLLKLIAKTRCIKRTLGGVLFSYFLGPGDKRVNAILV